MFLLKKLKKLYHFENYLEELKNAAYRISLIKTKMRGPYTKEKVFGVNEITKRHPLYEDP